MKIKNVNDFIERSELFVSGRIVPTWLMRVSPRKSQHLLKFGSDCYVLRTGKENIVGFHGDYGIGLSLDCEGCALLFGGENCDLKGSPYAQGGIHIVNISHPNAINSINSIIDRTYEGA